MNSLDILQTIEQALLGLFLQYYVILYKSYGNVNSTGFHNLDCMNG